MGCAYSQSPALSNGCVAAVGGNVPLTIAVYLPVIIATLTRTTMAHSGRHGRSRRWRGGASACALLAAFMLVPSVTAQDGDGLRGPLVSGSVYPDATMARQDEAQAQAGTRNFQTSEDIDEPMFGDPFADDAIEPPPRPAIRVQQPELDEIETGGTRAPRLTGLDELDGRVEAEAAQAPLELRGRRDEDDPFAPLGIRVGGFLVTPTLEQGIGATTNAASAPGGRSSVFSETALRLDAISDWSRHAATAEADLRYRRSVSGAELDELEGGARATLRHDLAGDFAALYAFAYRVRPEAASTPGTVEAAVSRPLRHTLDGSAAIGRDVGKLRFSLRGGALREAFGDAELADGSTVSQADRDYTLATVSLRTGYSLSPALTPFVEGEIGRRLHDNRIDAQGYERSADRYSLRAGIELDLREKLTGEIAAGWVAERPDDDRLSDLSAPYLSAALAWSPLRGTNVALTGSTTLENATAPGDDGSVLYAGDIALTHRLRHNLTANALLGLEWRDFESGGSEQEWTGEAGLTWWLNRHAGVSGRLRHEIFRSSLPDRDYSASSVYVGMTFQR